MKNFKDIPDLNLKNKVEASFLKEAGFGIFLK